MKRILLVFTMLVAMTMCRFYQKEQRNYMSTIFTIGKAVAVSPATVYVPSVKQDIDFAIGTSTGDVYLGSLRTFDLIPNLNITPYPIKNMTWNHLGLHIASEHQVQVHALSRSFNITFLTLNFQDEIKNAVFGYLWNGSILTAVSFNNRIEVYMDQRGLANLPLSRPCFSMSFTSSGFEFYYIAFNQSINSYVLSVLDIMTGILTPKNSNIYNEQSSLVIVPMTTYTVPLSSSYSKLTQWTGGSTYTLQFTSVDFDHIEANSFGTFVVGYNSAKTGYVTGITVFDISPYLTYVVDRTYQSIPTDHPAVDVDTRGNIILCLAQSEYLYIYELSTYSFDPTWVIIVACVILFLIFVAVCVAIRKKRLQKQREMQNGAYISHEDIATPIIPAPYNNQGFSQNQGFNQNQGINQGFNQGNMNQGFNQGNANIYPQLYPPGNNNQGFNPYGASPYSKQ